MNLGHGGRPPSIARRMSAHGVCILLAAVLALSACTRQTEPKGPAFPVEPAGRLEIKYPLDETLFPPEIVAPTFVWSDETPGVASWAVLLRFGDGKDVLRFAATEPSWRPSEQDWADIKRRSVTRDAEVAIVGLGPEATAASSAIVRIRTSTDPVGDSIFYREVPLPFLSAVQDPSRIRWRFGSIDSQQQPPIVLEDLPVCGNCHSCGVAATTRASVTPSVAHGAVRAGLEHEPVRRVGHRGAEEDPEELVPDEEREAPEPWFGPAVAPDPHQRDDGKGEQHPCRDEQPLAGWGDGVVVDGPVVHDVVGSHGLNLPVPPLHPGARRATEHRRDPTDRCGGCTQTGSGRVGRWPAGTCRGRSA